jgi:hypothetical protein
MNAMMYVQIKNGSFEEYQAYVESLSDVMSKFCRDLALTKVDANTAIATCDLFDPEGMKAILASDIAKQKEVELGLERSLYNLTPFE